MTNDPKYLAGLEAAAGICDENVKYYTENFSTQHAGASAACAEDIRATTEQSQPQEVQPVAYGKWAENSDRLAKYDGVPRVSFTQSEHFNIPLYTHPYDPAALTAAGFASVEDLLAAYQGAQKDIHRLETGIKCALLWANGRQSEWGERAENSFEFLECALLSNAVPEDTDLREMWGKVYKITAAAPAPEPKP